jgi:hypothetical protein
MYNCTFRLISKRGVLRLVVSRGVCRLSFTTIILICWLLP